MKRTDLIEHNGSQVPAETLAEQHGVPWERAYHRANVRLWSPLRACTEPVAKSPKKSHKWRAQRFSRS